MSFKNRFTALFRGPDGNLIPGGVDGDGNLNAALAPFSDPSIAFQLSDQAAVNTAASVSLAGAANTRRVINYIYAGMSQQTATSNVWRVILTDSIDGILWSAEFGLRAIQSQNVRLTGLFIYSAEASDLTLEFTPVGAPVVDYRQSVGMGGFSVGV